MTTVRSFRTLARTDKQIAALDAAGHGNRTNIIRTAIDRMAREELQNMTDEKVYDYCTDKFGNVDTTYTLPQFREAIEEMRQEEEKAFPHIDDRNDLDDFSMEVCWYDPKEWEFHEDTRQDDETGEWHDVVFVGDELSLISVEPCDHPTAKQHQTPTAIDRMAREELQNMTDEKVYDSVSSRFGDEGTYTLSEFRQAVEEKRQSEEATLPLITEMSDYDYYYHPKDWVIIYDTEQNQDTGEWLDVVYVGDDIALISVQTS